MIEGRVIDDYLNVRPFGASLEGDPEELPFSKGERIYISKAVYGDSINGNEIWYQLETGEFVWSGYVNVQKEIKPQEKRLIFTADDYGVVRSINEGIISAVKKGMLKSVTCLTNYYKDEYNNSIENIKKLREAGAGQNLELGIHLTITSGNPLLGRSNVRHLCRPEKEVDSHYEFGDFFGYTQVLKAYKKMSNSQKLNFCKELEEEWSAQIEVFIQEGIPIAHLTTHHNVHLFHDDFFPIYMRLCNKYKAKTRSLNNIPAWKEWAYMRGKGKLKFPLANINDLKKIFCERHHHIKTPGFLNSAHYGPLPTQKNYGFFLRNLVAGKKSDLVDMINQLRWGDYDSMEFLLHLRIDNKETTHLDFRKESRETGYDGINFLAFDSRTAEYLSFTGALPSNDHLPIGVKVSSWSSLEDAEACAL